MNPSSVTLYPRRLWLAVLVSVFICSGLCFGASHDDERIGGLREQIRTLESVIAGAKSPAERGRLENKLQRVKQELTILEERLALDAKARTLTLDTQRSTADALRDALRGVDRTVEAGEARVREMVERRKKAADERAAMEASLAASKERGGQNADRIADQEERLYTKNEELRALALMRESAEEDIELARDAERLREQLKQFDPHQRSSLKAMFDSYTAWRQAVKIEAQLNGLAGNIERNLTVCIATLELAQQKLAKFDEELALLEKQRGFFASDQRVERLIANQRSQKIVLGERIPFLNSQIDALTRTQQSLKLRHQLLQMGARLQEEQLRALQQSYYQRLRWPAVVIISLVVLYLALAYAVFPIVLRTDGLLFSRRLARYGACILAAGAIAGFLFDDLSMVAATMGVVSAALVISLQDVCTSVFGWFVIMLGGKFGIGHRLEVEGAVGDVIDIQLLRTTMLEINGWLGADEPTGRVIILPNNFIFKTKVFNFSHGHPHIWSKIELTVSPGTPVAKAINLFQRVLTEETHGEFASAREEAHVMKRRYGIEDATYEPRISTKIVDTGVLLTLFFVSHYRKTWTVKNRINRRLIAELERHPEIQLANPTMNLMMLKNSDKPAAVLGADATTPPFPVTATTVDAPMTEDVRVETLPGLRV